MQVGKVVVSQGGMERVLSEDVLTLTINTVSGDKTHKSMACVSLPMDGSTGYISTLGNASVCNGASPLSLRLNGGSKKLKSSSPTGGFAVAQIRLQGDTQLEYFDFLFGSKGQSEIVSEKVPGELTGSASNYFSTDYNHAAPLTPLESPKRCFTSLVSTLSENTQLPHSAGTFLYSRSMLDMPPPSTMTSGSRMLITKRVDN